MWKGGEEMFKINQTLRQEDIRQLKRALDTLSDLRAADISDYFCIDEEGNLDIDRRSLNADLEELYQLEFERFVDYVSD